VAPGERVADTAISAVTSVPGIRTGPQRPAPLG